MKDEQDGRIRLDKWLWYARFIGSRTAASRLCVEGRIRLSGALVTKAHHWVRPGDVLTFPLAGYIRVIKVLDCGTRRGPAREAQLLYEDLMPPSAETALPPRLQLEEDSLGREFGQVISP